MSDPKDLLAYLGTDSGKWAAEFCKAARDKRVAYDEDLMRGWFAQAIMAGRIEGANMRTAADERTKRTAPVHA